MVGRPRPTSIMSPSASRTLAGFSSEYLHHRKTSYLTSSALFANDKLRGGGDEVEGAVSSKSTVLNGAFDDDDDVEELDQVSEKYILLFRLILEN